MFIRLLSVILMIEAVLIQGQELNEPEVFHVALQETNPYSQDFQSMDNVESSNHFNTSRDEQVTLIQNGAGYRYEPGTKICNGGKCDTCPKGVPLDWNRDLTTCEFYDIAWDKHEEGGWLALCKHVGYFDPIIYTIGGIRYPKWDAYNGCCSIWHKRACPPKYVAYPEELWGTTARFFLESKHRSLLDK